MKNISNSGEKTHTTWNDSTVTQHEHFSCEILVCYSQNFVKELYVMETSGYDFLIQRAEIDKKTLNTSNNETTVGLCNLIAHWVIISCVRYISVVTLIFNSEDRKL
jgi:hypothetical protein